MAQSHLVLTVELEGYLGLNSLYRRDASGKSRKEMSLIDYLVIYAFSFSGTPYRWGGSTPIPGDGLDCSGFVQLPLKAAGVINYNVDLSAQDLYDLFTTSTLGTPLKEPQPGALSFYGKPHHITHVGFVVSDKMMLSAAGGTEVTLTKEDAILANAYVKLLPVNYRKDLVAVILPNYQ